MALGVVVFNLDYIIQKYIKCKLGLHIVRVRQTPLRDRYAEPTFYCLCCYKKL